MASNSGLGGLCAANIFSGRGPLRIANATARKCAIWDMDVKKYAAIILESGIVAFPTETVYGLGCNALDPVALELLYEVKGRPKTNPLILHVHDVDAALRLYDTTADDVAIVMKLADAFWPGPMSIICKASKKVPRRATADSDFVAVRIPDKAVTLEFLKACDVPVAGPSANLSGSISPTTAEHVKINFPDLMVLDGGPCRIGIESTVLKVYNSSIIILRQGAITKSMILSALPFVTVTQLQQIRSPEHQQHSPGTMLKHYAPSCPAFILQTGALSIPNGSVPEGPVQISNSVVLNVTGRDLPVNLRTHSLPPSPGGAMRDYYAALYHLDAQNPGSILIAVDDALIQSEEYQALLDRIFRTASGYCLKTADIDGLD